MVGKFPTSDMQMIIIVLLAESETELQGLIDRLDEVSQKFGLMINIDKTKVMGMDSTASNCSPWTVISES